MPIIDRRMGVTGSAVNGADPAHASRAGLGGLEYSQPRDALPSTRDPCDDFSNTMFSITRQDDGEVDARLVTLERIEER